MIVWILLAGVAAYAVSRRGGDAPSSDLTPGGQELGLADDGTFVIVESSATSAPPWQDPTTTQVGAAPVPGCAPGRDCCDDCRSGKVEVGAMRPGQNVVGTEQVRTWARAIAQRIAGGDLDAVRRAEQIFVRALHGGDLRARYVAEEITREMDHYTPGSGAAQYAVHGGWWREKAIDDPNLRLL